MLLTYNFLLPLVLEFSDDKDVLTNVLPTGKFLRPYLLNYQLKRVVNSVTSDNISLLDRYLPVVVTAIKDVDTMEALRRVPRSVKHLILDDWFNYPLVPGCVPPVRSLTFGYVFNSEVQVGSIPDSVTHLTFGHRFNQRLTPGAIPSSVTSLTFGADFNQPLSPGIIPDSVTHLKFGLTFTQHIHPFTIPNSVTHLEFGFYFNQPLQPDCIPPSVQNLSFGWSFKQHLHRGLIPPSVIHLTVRTLPVDVKSLADSEKDLTLPRQIARSASPVLIQGVSVN